MDLPLKAVLAAEAGVVFTVELVPDRPLYRGSPLFSLIQPPKLEKSSPLCTSVESIAYGFTSICAGIKTIILLERNPFINFIIYIGVAITN